ncbi:flippase [Shewanella sp. HN-41]|uniref:flippase n=1 Tax=Shewanella sp. HN-41 TaxID=327275 RepID=UPI0002125F44|nr:flippase [Shewanella sp. HN-41]EGM69252.1 polysaccharide biosynthesis protein [Shewanella sp. HN-41]
MKSNVFKNTLWMLLEKSSRLVIGVLISSLMARNLGPEGFGQLNFYISLLSIASVLSSLGLNRIIVREVANHIGDKFFGQNTVVTALYLRLFVSLTLWITAIAVSSLIWSEELLFIAVVFASLFFISFDVFDFYAQGISDFKRISLCRLATFFIVSLLKVGVIMLGGGVEAFIWLVMIEYLLVALFFYLFFIRRHKLKLAPKQINVQRGLDLVKESWPEIIAGFGAILFMRLDQIFLQWLAGDASVGIYSAATRITEAWYFLPSVIIATTFPKLVSLRSSSYENYFEGIKMLMSFLVTLSFVVAIFFSLTADWIVSLLFGPTYAESANVIVLHTWGGIFLCMGLTSGSWLVAEKKLKLNLQRNLFGLAVSAITNWTLIPIYGVTGSAIATVAGLSAAFYFYDFLHPQLRPMFWLKSGAFIPTHLYHFVRERK